MPAHHLIYGNNILKNHPTGMVTFLKKHHLLNFISMGRSWFLLSIKKRILTKIKSPGWLAQWKSFRFVKIYFNGPGLDSAYGRNF